MSSALSASSVVSHPERGKGGKSSYRGNAGANFMKDVMLFGMENIRLKPQDFYFVDANEGSGTSRDVAKELGIIYTGLDLHGIAPTIQNDFTKDSIADKLIRPADMVFTHPPYADMIHYSGSQWGTKMLDSDTSNPNISKEQFLEMSQTMLMNQREATRDGGLYATLIGDMRRKGEFWSFQADYQLMMPKSELISVAIKMQHNYQSNGKNYGGSFIPITHEYLLIWKKKAASIFAIGFETASQIQKKVSQTWRNVIRIAMMRLKQAKLSDIYTEVEKIAGALIAQNRNWQAKIRQQLQKHYTNVERGVWAA
jgi:predicted membrane protein